GCRFRGIERPTQYLLLYDADTLAAFDSPAYYARLRDPTPRSRAILPCFRDTCRTACAVERRIGSGIGPVALAFRDAYEETFEIVERHGPLRLDLLHGQPAVGQARTTEQELRGGADAQIDAAIIAFFADVDAARAASRENASFFAEIRHPRAYAHVGETFELVHSVSAGDT
ncbi:MAG: hypothetical protein AB7O88_27795, partial [Reyranellaceae bacterium]